jgi:hypothetical protein
MQTWTILRSIGNMKESSLLTVNIYEHIYVSSYSNIYVCVCMFNCLYACMYMYVYYSTFHHVEAECLVSVGVGSRCGMGKVVGSSPLGVHRSFVPEMLLVLFSWGGGGG